MRSRLGPAVALAATLLALIPSAASATGGAIAGVPQADAGALSTSDRHSCFVTASGKVPAPAITVPASWAMAAAPSSATTLARAPRSARSRA